MLFRSQKIFWKVPNQYLHVVKTISGGDPTGQLSTSDVARNLQDWAAGMGRKVGAEDKKKEGRGLLGFWNR